MMLSWTAAFLLGAATVAAVPPAAAVELPLSPQGRIAAVEAGRRMAGAEGGYHVRDYVLFETDDALVARPGEGEIYAVTLRTPFERARWMSYARVRQGTSVTDAAVDAQAAEAVDVIVYVRSTDARGRDVLDRIHLPVLTLDSRRRLDPLAVERGRPFRASQMVADADGLARPEERWLGTIAYRFELTSADAGSATFEIVDGTGRTYRLETDLSRFR
jgi:hypothetical protein